MIGMKQCETTFKSVSLAVNFTHNLEYQHIGKIAILCINVKRSYGLYSDLLKAPAPTQQKLATLLYYPYHYEKHHF
jgi:hypothetical protein